MDIDLAKGLVVTSVRESILAQRIYPRDRQVGLDILEFGGMLLVHALDAKDELPQHDYWKILDAAMAFRALLEVEQHCQDDPGEFKRQLQFHINKLITLQHGLLIGVWLSEDGKIPLGGKSNDAIVAEAEAKWGRPMADVMMDALEAITG